MFSNNLIASVSVGLIILVVAIIAFLKFTKPGGSKQSTNASKLAGKLRDERVKSDIILNGIDDGVILLDEGQTIQLFNPAAAKITGWTIEEALGINWAAVIKLVNDKGQDYESTLNPFHLVYEQGHAIHDNNANLQSKSGKVISLSLTVSPLLDNSQQISGAIAVLRDVTKERKEEAQRAEFISTASHEMRTPVAAIEGYLALALNDRVSSIDSRARGYLDKAHESTQHLGKLFQDLLTSAKAEDGRLTSHPVVVEVGEFLQGLTNDLKFAAEKKGMIVEFTVGNGLTVDARAGDNKVVKPLYYSVADPDRMREVITNLFDNAVKYSEKGRITIGLTGDDKVVQFFIKDTGHGIPAEDIPHLFQKFYRVDNSNTRTIGGTGLGLFISRKIVELYGGRIWVESEVGKGSTFYINLPRISTQKAEELKKNEAAETQLKPITTLTQT
ncbi:PAS domain S-box protein [Candidatus Saccharibacteria bacterium]|nr:PAS domain S-box protein [Candidatus Saccharibacteria bacterium]